ncbi:MAG: Crp/Fnr family transcriptional regulator [Chthoniobacterales bacterium]
MANTLRSCQLFIGLPASDIEAVACFALTNRLAKDDYLFREGDPARGFYVVQQGRIKVHRVNASGKEQVIHVFSPAESFAEGSLASAVGYPADARATEASVVLLIPKREFTELLRSRPELALRMLGAMSQHLRVLVGLLDDLALKDTETRVANWLLKRCPRPLRDGPAVIELDRTKRVLAAELGATSETLSRTFAKFREQKLLQVAGRTITVTQPRQLERLLQRFLGEL